MIFHSQWVSPICQPFDMPKCIYLFRSQSSFPVQRIQFFEHATYSNSKTLYCKNVMKITKSHNLLWSWLMSDPQLPCNSYLAIATSLRVALDFGVCITPLDARHIICCLLMCGKCFLVFCNSKFTFLLHLSCYHRCEHGRLGHPLQLLLLPSEVVLKFSTHF